MVLASHSTMVGMETIADRLREARTLRKLRQGDLAEAAGVTPAAISALEKGLTKSPTPETLFPLARKLGVSPEWLITGKGSRESGPILEISRSETVEGYVRFPLLEGFAGMGRGDYVGDYPEIVEFVEVTREWASAKLRNVPFEAVRVITGRGQSMRGMYDDGDLIFIDSRVKRFVDDAAYVFRLGGRVQVKRLQWRGDKLRILSANPAYEPMDVEEDDLEIGGMALAAWTLKEF